jgi:addiction module toxin, RelE/StbE family
MLPTVWNAEAIEDAERIIEYIRERDQGAAERVRDRLVEVANNLSQYPYGYRQGRVPGTREAVALPNYILIYKVEIDMIRVVQVLHASQQYPPE